MRDYVVKADILETDLLDRLLEVTIVQDLKSVAIDKEHRVALYLSVAGLDQAFIPRLLPSLVAIKP